MHISTGKGALIMAASIPNRISRTLLAAEAVVIVLPVLMMAVLLSIAYLMWAVVIVGSMTSGLNDLETVLPIFVVTSVSAFVSVAYAANVAQLSIRYVRHGRREIANVSRLEWLSLLAGAMVLPCWFVAYHISPDSHYQELMAFFLPGALLALPTLHLFAAKMIADRRVVEARDGS
ncbi:hypothetical protein HIV01_005030 [Lysobacter arenosi]|uniref:Uncharacterized protein n=1 Tax=Lysobacter arenosi TaxID=2795387 RepID=A0ABX7REQ5_9GAMM|nr:hypothetical protein [Lysobacter arenosi]QSX75874.1 hypothetical protein HIV01_005030 [Lysobacter arenosi]